MMVMCRLIIVSQYAQHFQREASLRVRFFLDSLEFFLVVHQKIGVADRHIQNLQSAIVLNHGSDGIAPHVTHTALAFTQ
jgi:hypothetical protein